MDVPPPQGEDDFGNLQLPLLNPVRDATLAYGDWGDRSRLADMGLYQGRRIGPYVEQTYLQLLEQRYLPSLFNGLVKAMNAAPPESEEKLAVLRVMRMLEDKSGRNNEVVKQYMAKRWSEKFHGQRDIQAQLMSHLDYALAHTDWHAERQAGDGDAISRWTPYDKPVVSAQKELSKLPVYQRVYQSLKTRAPGVLPADLYKQLVEAFVSGSFHPPTVQLAEYKSLPSGEPDALSCQHTFAVPQVSEPVDDFLCLFLMPLERTAGSFRSFYVFEKSLDCPFVFFTGDIVLIIGNFYIL